MSSHKELADPRGMADVAGHADVESPQPSSGSDNSPANGGHVLEFNIANFSTPQGKQILHDVGKYDLPRLSQPCRTSSCPTKACPGTARGGTGVAWSVEGTGREASVDLDIGLGEGSKGSADSFPCPFPTPRPT